MDGENSTPNAETTPQDVDEVKAETVNVTGNVKEITAQTVNVQDGAIAKVSGETVTVGVTKGGVGAVVADKADVTVNEGGVGAVLAKEANVKSASIGFVAAGKLSGDAKIMFDVRAGIAAGIAMGVVMCLFRMIFGRRKCC